MDGCCLNRRVFRQDKEESSTICKLRGWSQERPPANHAEHQGLSNIQRSPKPDSTASNPSPPLHTDPKSPIADVSLPTEQARTSEGGDWSTSSARYDGRALRDKDLPAQITTYFKTRINLISDHSRRHPVEANTPASEASLFN